MRDGRSAGHQVIAGDIVPGAKNGGGKPAVALSCLVYLAASAIQASADKAGMDAFIHIVGLAFIRFDAPHVKPHEKVGVVSLDDAVFPARGTDKIARLVP